MVIVVNADNSRVVYEVPNAGAQEAALAAPLQRLVGPALSARPISCIPWVL